jgi:hypothetical protein
MMYIMNKCNYGVLFSELCRYNIDTCNDAAEVMGWTAPAQFGMLLLRRWFGMLLLER